MLVPGLGVADTGLRLPHEGRVCVPDMVEAGLRVSDDKITKRYDHLKIL